ncbi:MAG TPA: VTT domain-containing protein [Burkholderiales bacterium]|nr:VTT domain-containing protein [Burkholderiales bacterium]
MRGKQSRKPAWGKIIAAIVVFVALAAAWRYTPLSEYLTGARIRGWAQAMRDAPFAAAWAVLSYIPASFIMFPRPLLTLFTVIAFGPWLGFTYSMLGIIIAALTHYYTGVALPERTVKHLAGDRIDDYTNRLRNHGFVAIFAIRMVPIAPFPVEGIMAGAARISVRDYTIGTFLGMLPGVLATTVYGRQIERALKDASTINYWVLGAVALIFILITVAVGLWFKQQSAPSST